MKRIKDGLLGIQAIKNHQLWAISEPSASRVWLIHEKGDILDAISPQTGWSLPSTSFQPHQLGIDPHGNLLIEDKAMEHHIKVDLSTKSGSFIPPSHLPPSPAISLPLHSLRNWSHLGWYPPYLPTPPTGPIHTTTEIGIGPFTITLDPSPSPYTTIDYQIQTFCNGPIIDYRASSQSIEKIELPKGLQRFRQLHDIHYQPKSTVNPIHNTLFSGWISTGNASIAMRIQFIRVDDVQEVYYDHQDILLDITATPSLSSHTIPLTII